MASNQDIFAPPSPEELEQVTKAPAQAQQAAAPAQSASSDDALFAPPSPDELKSAGAPAPSVPLSHYIKNFGLGVADILPGAAPKVNALLQTGYDKAKGALTGEETPSFGELFKAYEKVNKKPFEQAKQETPITYGVGSLTGPLALGLVTAGAGLGAGLPAAAEAAAPTIGEQALGSAAVGGLFGAAGGITNADDLTTAEGRNQAAKDALTSGALGFGLGGALGAGAGALEARAANKLASKAAPMEAAVEEAAQPKYTPRFGSAPENLVGGEESKSLAADVQARLKINDNLDPKEIQPIVADLESYKKAPIRDAKELYDLRNRLKNLDGGEDPTLEGRVSDLVDNIDDQISQKSPDYAKALEAQQPEPGMIEKFAKDSPTIQKIMAAYNRGVEGKGYRGYANREDIFKQTRDASEDLASKLIAPRRQASEMLGQALEQPIQMADEIRMPDSQGSQDLIRFVNDNPQFAGSQDINQMQAVLQKYRPELSAEGVTGQPLFNLRKDLIEVKNNMDTPQIRDIANKTIDSIDTILQRNPDYSKAMGLMKQYSEAAPEVFLGKTVGQYGVDKAQDVLGSRLEQVGQRYATEGIRGEAGQRRLAELSENLQGLKDENPDLFKSIGADDIIPAIQNLKQAGIQEEVRRKVSDASLIPLSIGKSGLKLNLEQPALQAANTVGKIAGVGKAITESKAGSAVSAFSRSLYHAPDEVLRGTAELLRSGGFHGLAESLENGLDQKNRATVNAILFAVLQNPKSRALLSDNQLGTPSNER